MKEKIGKIIKFILIVLAIEVILFNITSYSTFFGKYNVKEFNKNDFEILSKENGKVNVKINNINEPISTIKLVLNNTKNEIFEYQYYYSDETTKESFSLPKKVCVTEQERTKYIPCYLSGKVNYIILSIDENILEKSVEKIVINEKIPIEFNTARFTTILALFLIVDFFKNSEIMKKEYNSKDFKQECVLIFVLIIYIVGIGFINVNSLNEFEKEDIYNKGIVDAFLSGSLSLLKEPTEKFLNVENPYDALDRTNYDIQRGGDYLWDTAYYNGKFYVYFGVLPIVALFLPYHILTGKYLSPTITVFLLSVGILILLKEILCKIYEKYFEKIPFKMIVLSLATLYSGSLIFYINGCVRFYEVAIVSGVFCVLMGLFLILKSMENEIYKYKYIFFGSLFLALSVACRPTNVICSLIVVPYFLREFINSLKKKDLTILKCVMSIAIPYIIVAVPLMWYNYARFGSVFEFGAKYQITINNMTTLKSRLYAIPTGLICNLFSIPDFIPDFPFLVNHNKLTTFYGFYFIENMIGGLFILAPIAFMNFALLKYKNEFENKSAKINLILLVLAGVLIATISSAMGGSIERYVFDYAWIFVLSGILIFLYIYMKLKSEEAKKIFMKIMCIITVYTIIINIFAGIVSEKDYFKNFSTKEYYKTKYSICFWE